MPKKPEEIWIPKGKAAAAYRISARQLQRYMADGRVRTSRPDPLGPALVLRDDLEKMDAARHDPAVRAALHAITAPRPAPALPAGSESEAGDAEPDTLFCRVREAARITGLSMAYLRAAARVGAAAAVNLNLEDGEEDWRFCRGKLGEVRNLSGDERGS